MSDPKHEYAVRVTENGHAVRVTTWQDADEWKFKFHIDGVLIDEGDLGED